MVLQHVGVAEYPFEDRRSLVDDRGEGDGIDDAAVAVSEGVVEREAQRRQRLAPAGGHGEREEARRFARLRTHMGEDFAA
jgi:hypothetical protein